jgi:dipeptidyl aminopeptidase/acylaminoacyl peptidase
VDFRSDQFSLGSILYEMATGERAFQRPTAAQTMAAIIQDEPEPIAKRNAKVPAPLRWIVERCLSKEPDHRYASTRDLAKELATLRDHLSEAVSTAEIPAAAPRGRTGRLAAVALALAASWAGVYLAATRAATRPVPTLKRLTFRRGSISPGAARFAPDEKTIVYSAEWDGAPSEVFTTRIDGPESRPLGLPGAGLISVSSRGELAIGQGDPSTLATVSLGGGAPRPLLENVDSADWGPDGRLAVVRDGNRLEYPPGKVLYRSSRLLSPVRVSPRGDRVAVIEHAPVFADAVLLVVDAGGRSRRLAAARCMMGLAWSPRGDEIWFSAGENLAVNPHAVTLDGKERRVAALPDMAIVDDVSPTGRVLVAHVSARSQIAGLFPGQTVERDLTWLDASGVTDISADGKTILFGENGEGGGSERSVYVRRTDGSIPVRLGSGSAFALSPDGKLVFSRAWPNGGNQAVLLPTGPGEPKPLVLAALERARQMAWFPDGRRFVVSGNEKGRPERCWVVDVSEGKPRPLGPEGLTDPVAVSPDGTRLLARDVRGTAAASHPFAVYTIEGGAIRVLAGTGELDGPLRWGPEGRSFLAFHSIGDRKTQIVRVDAETGTQQVIRELVPADPAGQFGAPDPVVTPDGRYYAYNLVRFLADLYVVDGVR